MGPARRDRSMGCWFAFLGRAFLPPEPPELRRLIGELRDRTVPNGAHERRLARMEAALGSGGEELQKEYMRLFLNPAGSPCPPWQSAHADEPQPLGPAHRSALAWYRAAGIEPKNPAEPADHVALLLAFYASLVETGNAADILSAFYEEHLAWMIDFCGLLALEAQHPFYRELADTTRGLLEQARSG